MSDNFYFWNCTFILDGELMTTIEEAVEKINGLEQGQDDITTIVTNIQATQGTTDLKLDDIRALVAALKQSGATPEQVDAVNLKLDSLVAKQTAIKTQLADLAAQATSIRDEANTVE